VEGSSRTCNTEVRTICRRSRDCQARFLERLHFIRIDLIFDKVALHDTPELYRFVHAAYTYEPIVMIFGEHQLLSGEMHNKVTQWAHWNFMKPFTHS